MDRKNNRTLDKYKYVGAKMCLCKELVASLVVSSYAVVSASDSRKLTKAFTLINEVCSNAEDNMFRDFPELDNSYVAVFHVNIRNDTNGTGEPVSD